jgi:hypothetical protein
VAVVNASSTRGRIAIVLVVLGIVAAPAVVLRLACAGNACTQDAAAAEVPFCPLPAALRAEIAAGFRAGRSPDVLAAAGAVPVITDAAGQTVPWPAAGADLRVPIAFAGPAIHPDPLPAGTGLDQIAPTLAAALGIERPHPEVAAGEAVPGVVPGSDGGTSNFGVLIVWKGVGTADLHGRWPVATAHRLRGAASTLEGTVGSQPLDPAAVETTIGTGGLPFQHGITGTLIHSAAGGVATAWSHRAPTSVITTLADDLDHLQGDRAAVGLVAPARTDLGLIGDGWYLGADEDQVVIRPHDPVSTVDAMLGQGYGAGPTTDLLGVVLQGSVHRMDGATAAILDAVRAHDPAATIVVTATGSLRTARAASSQAVGGALVARRAARAVGGSRDPVAAQTAGGLFLDASALRADGLSADAVVEAMRAVAGPEGDPLFADSYPGFSVAFARYC